MTDWPWGIICPVRATGQCENRGIDGALKKKIEQNRTCASRITEMKLYLTIAVAALSMAAFATSTFAEGSGCGSCPVSGEKAKDKTEEGTQS